eukprot:324292-Rhodomonas_salina.2
MDGLSEIAISPARVSVGTGYTCTGLSGGVRPVLHFIERIDARIGLIHSTNTWYKRGVFALHRAH